MPAFQRSLMRLLCFILLSSAASAQIPRFSLSPTISPLRSIPEQQTYFDVIGRKAAVLGKENGDFEAWIFPFQILKQFHLQFRLANLPAPAELKPYVQQIEVLPERTTLTYSHPLFTLREHIFVPIQSPAIVILLEISTFKPIEIFASFTASMQPMWPAGLGGQYAFWDRRLKAYILSESRRRYNAIIGTPNGQRQSPPLAHELPQRPNLFKFEVHPDSAQKQYFPIVITADFSSRQACIEKYNSLLHSIPALYAKTRKHYKQFLNQTLQLQGTEFDLPLLWNKIAMHKGYICNPDLGSGMVAGFGPSGVSRRPGFAWFFGGDAFINSFAMVGYGDNEVVKQSIKFLQKYQRKDGKMMHELSQAGGLIDWFGEYPYAYIHGDTSPFYLAALDNFFKSTADTAFIRQSWPSIQKAYDWCRSTDSNADGLMENTLAGLGASELGSLREASGVDIFLAAIGVQGWKSFAELAGILGKKKIAKKADEWYNTGKTSLEKLFWNPDSQRYNFSLTQKGRANPELTAWSAFPMIFDLLPDAHARQSLMDMASSKISTDWGSRMLSRTSPAYDPIAYNNGAVWPFLTGYVIWALYRQHYAEAGLQNLRNLANWLEVDALGAMPEVASGEYFRPLETSVPHQLFSNFGFTAGLIKGLLGLDVDAPHRVVKLKPHLPPDWHSFQIKNIIIGKDTLSLQLSQDFNHFRLQLIKIPKSPIILDVQPAFGPYAKLDSLNLARGLKIDELPGQSDMHFRFQLPTAKMSQAEFRVKDPLRVWLPYKKPGPGDSPQQIKICTIEKLSGRRLEILLEAPGGSEKVLNYHAAGKVNVENATILDESHILVSFAGKGYVRKKVIFTLLP